MSREGTQHQKRGDSIYQEQLPTVGSTADGNTKKSQCLPEGKEGGEKYYSQGGIRGVDKSSFYRLKQESG